MGRHFSAVRTALCIALGWMALAHSHASAAAPVVTGAVSRMTHGTAGAFDIQLPLSGASGIECRTPTNGLTIVVTFDQAVTSGTAAVTAGGAVAGVPVFAGSTMTVPLTGIANAQAVTLSLGNVVGAGGTLVAQDIPFRTLIGDVNGSGSMTASDVNLCKFALGSGSAVNGGNFRSDINADGHFTVTDVNLIKFQIGAGMAVAGGATLNTAPTISTIGAQTDVTGLAMTPAGFTVGDAESDPNSLYASATSSNTAVIPNSGISVTGTGTSRTISITSASGIVAVTPVTITLTVSDGLLTTSTTFTVNVIPAPTVYLATLAPIPGIAVQSLGSGTATLTVSGDLTSAVLRYTVSNLTSGDSDDAVYAPGDQVLYDVPVGKVRGDQQPDGSFKWVFSTIPATLQLTINSISSNTAYMIIESQSNPAGELRGIFQKVVGSSTFTPPTPPNWTLPNPPTPSDASRLLQQAGFGGQNAEIQALANTSAPNASTAINDWLTGQFGSPLPISPAYDSATPIYSSSSMYKQIYDRVTTAQAPNAYGDNLDDNKVHEAWWKNANTAPDQLRQRVATALSEIFVVSEVSDNIDGNIPGLASYYDMLANDAFGNYRDLLFDVTLHPIMGDYLNMRGNKKATAPLNAAPNENYAREILQLFSVGLYILQPDGTLKLDQNGQPIPTYDQSVISNFAQVFTGWDLNGTPVAIPQLLAPVAPATQPSVSNFNSYYQKRMVLSPASGSNHSGLAKYLLGYSSGVSNGTYPTAPTYGPPKYTTGAATQPSFIPAGSVNATSAPAELNFAIDDIFNHPNVGPFFCKQLIQRLVGSNPSPAFVYRVSQVFANDGTGVRGNLKAVITAILTDYEARNPTLITAPGYGRMREPMIRLANIIRSGNSFSKTGKWKLGKTDTTIAQTILRSPTVFNFFDPHYAQPGAIQTAGLVSPEFDIIYETTITNAQNIIYTGCYATYTASPPTGTGFRGDFDGSDIYLDFSTAGNGLPNIAQTQGVGPLIDQVALLLNGGPLDAAVKNRIQSFITANIAATNYLAQSQAAYHLVATASQTAAMK